MTTKISGYQNGPAQVGTDKSVSRTRDGAKDSAQPAAPAKGDGAVQITGQARQLAALEQVVQALPIANEGRVAEIRQAIEAGRYVIEPSRIADKLLRMNQEL